MALPIPEPGLVISYEFLWSRERAAGRDAGAKSRPTIIILALSDVGGDTVITAVPMTHTQPGAETPSLEVPHNVKAHLGLDADRSWVILNEANRFVWPGADLRKTPEGAYDYGFLPPRLFANVRWRYQGSESTKGKHRGPRLSTGHNHP